MSDALTIGVGGGLTLNGNSEVAANVSVIPNLIDLGCSPSLETRYNLGDHSLKAIAGLGVMGPLGFFGYPYARASAVADLSVSQMSPGAEVGFLAPMAGELLFGAAGLGIELKVSASDVRDPLATGAAMLYINGTFSLYRRPDSDN